MAVYAWPLPIFLETLGDINRSIEIKNFLQKNPEAKPEDYPAEEDEHGNFEDVEIDRISKLSSEEFFDELTAGE